MLQEIHYPTEDVTPERVLLGREALEMVVEAIADLPARTGTCCVLHRFEGNELYQHCRELGISISAVEKHIMKALRVLHARLEAD